MYTYTLLKVDTFSFSLWAKEAHVCHSWRSRISPICSDSGLLFRGRGCMFIVQEKRSPKGLFCLANRTVGKIFCDCEGVTIKETGGTTKEITSNANGTTKETIKETSKEIQLDAVLT